MNVGSGSNDIKIGTQLNFDQYLSDGWREGFSCSWSGFTSNKYYNNTLLNESNYGGPGVAMTVGNAYNSQYTYYGWKFVYKPYSSTKIQWALLYTVVRDITSGETHFHNYANCYYLKVDGKDMVTTTPYNENGNQVVVSNGAGSSKIDGRQLGALPSLGSGGISAGTTFCTFYGTFTPSSSSSSNRKFPVAFTYVNTDYIGNYPTGYNLTWKCQCYSRSPENWGKATTWTRKWSKDAFLDKTFLYTNNALLAPANVAIRKQSATGTSVSNVSYYQNPVYVTTSDGKYVSLVGVSSDWKSSGQSYNIKNITSFPSVAQKTGSLTAKASFWNTGNWASTKNATVYFEPKVSYSWNGDNLIFSQFTPIDNRGYFNYLRIEDSNGNVKNYTKNFTSGSVTFNITKDSQTGRIIVDGETTALGGIDQFNLTFTCYCNADNKLYPGTSFTKSYGATDTGAKVSSVIIDYPNNGQNEAYLFYNQNGVLVSDICLSVGLEVLGQPGTLGDDDNIIVTYKGNNFIYPGTSYSVERQIYTLKLSQVQIDPEDTKISVSTTSNPYVSIEADLNVTAREFIDYSPIVKNQIVDVNLINALAYQITKQIQNYFYILNTQYQMDYTLDDKVFQNEFEANSRSMLYTDFHYALQDCVSYYRMISQIQYHNTSGIYEPLVLNPNLKSFVFNSDDLVENDLVPADSHILYIHELDDIGDGATSSSRRLQDRFLPNTVYVDGVLTPVQNQNPDLNENQSLLIEEEGKWNLIVAENNVLSPNQKTLVILQNYQKALIYLLYVFGYYEE